MVRTESAGDAQGRGGSRRDSRTARGSGKVRTAAQGISGIGVGAVARRGVGDGVLWEREEKSAPRFRGDKISWTWTPALP